MIVDPRDFTPEALSKLAPACTECTGQGASVVKLVSGAHIYPHRMDLWWKDGIERWWWRCENCGAYVGTHLGTIKPLGSPCGPETRRAREEAHAAFDPMWGKRMAISGISKTKARGRGYKWLAAQMGMDPKDCHIGMMNAAQARRVVEICRRAQSWKRQT